MPAKSVVQVSLLGGIAGNQEYFLKTKLETADNLYYQHPGGLRKRFGTAQLYNGTSTPLGDSGPATSPRALFGFGTENVRVDTGKIYGYAGSNRVLRDVIPEATATYTGLTGGEISYVYPDVASASGYTIVAFTTETDFSNSYPTLFEVQSNKGNVVACVYDANTGSVVYDRVQIATSASRVRLVVAGTYIVAVYADYATYNLYASVFDTANPANGFSAPTLLVFHDNFGTSVHPSGASGIYGGFTAAWSPFELSTDPAGTGNTFLVGFQSATDIGSVTTPVNVWRVTASTPTTFSSSLMWYSNVSYKNIFGFTICEGVSNVWVYWTGLPTSGTQIYTYGAAFPTSSSGATSAASTVYTDAYNNAVATLYCIETDSTHCALVGVVEVAGTNPVGYLYVDHFALSGGSLSSDRPGGSSITDCNFYTLVSKPWLHNGNVHVAITAGQPPLTNSSQGAYLMVVDTNATNLTTAFQRSAVRPIVNIMPRQVTYFGAPSYGILYRGYGLTASNVLVNGNTVSFVSFNGNTGANQSNGKIIKHTVTYDTPRTTAFGNGVQLLSGGVPCTYDGTRVAECGFLQQPVISAVNSTADPSGEIPPGTYNYVACYEWVDAVGNIVKGEPSAVQQIQLSPGAYNYYVGMTISFDKLTYRQDAAHPTSSPIKLAIYRTTNNGTQFFKIASLPLSNVFDNSAATVPSSLYVGGTSITDNCTDAQIQDNEELYTDGNVQENVSPPSATVVCVHNSRFWLAGTPDDTIWYSKTFITLQGAQFGAFNFIDPFPGGPVTALASLDDYLVVFKQRSIYIIQGDGNDVTGTNATLVLPPVRISAEIGCINPLSVVVVAGTCFFQGERGLYSLARGSYSVMFIGEDVQNYTQTPGSTITSAVHVPGENQVRFTWQPSTASNGKTLVYDLYRKCWTTFSYQTASGVNDSGAAGAMVNGTYCWAASAGSEWAESQSTWLDGGSWWVPMTIETAWIPLGTIQGYQRIQRVQVLAQKITDVNLTISKIFDYDPSKVDTGTTLTKDTYSRVTGTAPVQFEWGVVRQKSEAIKVNITDSAPTSPATVGTGQGVIVDNLVLFASVLRFHKPNAPSTSR
jgi:hypothetical protein